MSRTHLIRGLDCKVGLDISLFRGGHSFPGQSGSAWVSHVQLWWKLSDCSPKLELTSWHASENGLICTVCTCSESRKVVRLSTCTLYFTFGSLWNRSLIHFRHFTFIQGNTSQSELLFSRFQTHVRVHSSLLAVLTQTILLSSYFRMCSLIKHKVTKFILFYCFLILLKLFLHRTVSKSLSRMIQFLPCSKMWSLLSPTQSKFLRCRRSGTLLCLVPNLEYSLEILSFFLKFRQQDSFPFWSGLRKLMTLCHYTEWLMRTTLIQTKIRRWVIKVSLCKPLGPMIKALHVNKCQRHFTISMGELCKGTPVLYVCYLFLQRVWKD